MNKKLTAIKKIILSLLCIWFLGSCSNVGGNTKATQNVEKNAY